ncbi:toxin-antitoxin system YwqK family antitoxin [Vallitalea maricola]|uniref:Uncharacterized protein n=1 Tax=Vallitalea maricola TaxID=3074433 RepID=A0ACB5UM41_9FIRM|nr:hypothetical protein AN2V17_30770 [Vallitalea sp. AN17-2]
MMKKVEIDELEYIGYYTYEDEPFTGIAYELHYNGQVMSEVAMVGGVEDGLQTEYYDTGQIKSKLMMHNNWIHGYCVEWYEKGQIKMKSLIEYGIIVWQKQYGENGNLEYHFLIESTSDDYKRLQDFREKKGWSIAADE